MSRFLKTMLLTFAIFFSVCLIVILVACAWLFLGGPNEQKNIVWGVNFSKIHAENLKLDWKATYLAILEDLGVKNVKLLNDWKEVEPGQNAYHFDDIDWQLQQAQSHGATVIYVVGMKTGRWPECHIPDWADSLSLDKEQQQNEVLNYVATTINRYKSNSAILAWQAENEPFVNFGECPWQDKEFVKKEVALIKSLDPSRPVIVSDSGEQSWWMDAGEIGDLVSTTLYRKVGVGENANSQAYTVYPIKPSLYWQKSEIIGFLFGKKVFSGELQAEPWFPKNDYEAELKEQEKSMNLQQLEENIAYAKSTGFDTFYLWGAEWWYQLKEKHNKPEIWNATRNLFMYGNIEK